MATTRDLLITVIAIVVLVASMGAVWGIDQHKDEQRIAAQQAAPDREEPPPELPRTPNGSATPTDPATPTTSSSTTTTSTPTRSTPTPVPDSDGDGIPDGTDECPTRPETKNGFLDGDGCPDVVQTSTGAS